MKTLDIDNIIYKNTYSFPILLHIILIFIGFFYVFILFPKKCGYLIDNINNVNKKLIILTLFPFIIGHFVFYFADYIYAKYIHKIQGKIISEIMNEVLKSVKENPQPEINKMNIITNFIKLMEKFDVIHILTTYFIPTFVMSFGLFIFFIFVDKKIAFVSLGLSIIAFLLIIYTGKKCLNKSEIRYIKDIEFYNEIRDVVINMDNISTDNNIDYEINRLKDIRNRIKKHYITSEVYNTNFKGMISIIEFVVLIILGGMLLNLYNKGKIKRGDIIAYIYIIITLIGYYDAASCEVNSLFFHIGNYSQAKQYFKDFLKVDKKNDIINIKEGKIEYKNINIKLGNKEIISNFSVIIPSNKITGIIGEIGSGKSTLIKLLLGYHKYEGDILIDDINIKNFKFTEIRKYIGYIPQYPIFFNRTIYENLVYGTNIKKEELTNIINKYGLEEFINKFPEKLNTIIKNNGENLSGGQKQILYIIKIIILNKQIILMDEPTSNLDNYHIDLFMKIINKLNNKTIIIITHDNNIKKIFNNIIEIKKNN
jgi:ABC-type multidrug transport system fused ATPase/permease subunit